MFAATMSFTSLFKKATTLLGISSPESLKPPPLDGEIIYCKNNVCVHPPAPLSLDVEHFPGYLTLRSVNDDKSSPTLILTWIPNSTLKRNPCSIENSPNRAINTPKRSPHHTYTRTYDTTSSSSLTTSPGQSCCSGKVPASVSEFSLAHDIDDWSVTSDSALALDGKLSEQNFIYDNDAENVDTISEVSQSDKQHDNSVGLSSSAKSQCDSGICDEDIIQNNEVLMENAIKPPPRVGIKVNVLNVSKNTNRKHDVHRGVVTLGDGDESLSSDSDALTSEEQLAVLLNQSKLDGKECERRSSNRSVCVEMEGDKLVVVTEEDEMTRSRPPSDINVNPDGISCLTDDPLSPEYVISPTSANTPFNPQQCAAIVENMKTVASYTKTDTPDNHNDNCSNTVVNHTNVTLSSPVDIIEPEPFASRVLASSSSTTTSGPDSCPPSPYSSPCNSEPPSPDHSFHENPESPDSAKVSHNLTFPNNCITYHSRKMSGCIASSKMCGVFSVDLAQMRSLRLFYSDSECTRGQVVIASRESQYKILHFHHAGLDKLAEIFEEWSLFAQSKVHCESDSYKQFLIVRPQLTNDQCHPEEGMYGAVTDEMWAQHVTENGQIEDVHLLQKAIFFGGIEPSVRQHIWPFLLQYYSFKSTTEQREQIRNDRYIAYHNIRKARESMTTEELEVFWRNTQCIVEKDVIRTDRSHPYYRGDNNPNIHVLQDILLNYAVAHPRMGYTQGMSDLLAPVLAELKNEADAFWCFEGLMQKTIFVSSPKDHDMDKQLMFLQELIRVMLPPFYAHISTLGEDGMELLFCHRLEFSYIVSGVIEQGAEDITHNKSFDGDQLAKALDKRNHVSRWILLCFKREFSETEALCMWEACWAHYQTDYFHLFLCVAIIAIYGDDILEQKLPADEILLHFSSLAMHMNGELVLRKARGLLHEFRSLPRIPCTLHTLCALCGVGMWDSGHVPTVECEGHCHDPECQYTAVQSN